VDDYVWSPDLRKIAYDVRSFKDRKRSSKLYIFEIDKKEYQKNKGKGLAIYIDKMELYRNKSNKKKNHKNPETAIIRNVESFF